MILPPAQELRFRLLDGTCIVVTRQAAVEERIAVRREGVTYADILQSCSAAEAAALVRRIGLAVPADHEAVVLAYLDGLPGGPGAG